MSVKTYRINEIFGSIQGEGIRSGTANVFVRFSGCNLKCAVTDEFSGFDCDTEFASGVSMTAREILAEAINKGARCKAVIFTGGEPLLQLDTELAQTFYDEGFYLAIETNGTKEINDELEGLLHWICVSPKSAEHTIRVNACNELKYVRHSGQGLPKPAIQAAHKLISPAFGDDTVSAENLAHCIQMVKNNPEWRLSLRLHKFLNVR